MTQIGFPRSHAHKALDQFLADPSEASRWIGEHDDMNRAGNPDYGAIVAHIVSGERWDEVTNGYRQWMEAQEVRDELTDPPSGYVPWKHSPLASMDRSLPVEPLLDTLARAMFRQPYAELPDDAEGQWHVRAVAIMVLLEVQLDEDGQGAVPILAAAADHDEPGQGMRWQIAFRTGVRGLYLRGTAGFFGDEWAIVTGSGYRLASGWYDRDEASACVDALGRVLPNTDWMRLTPDGFTDRAQAAIKAVLRRYRDHGTDEQAPEPEVMDDIVPEPLPFPEAVPGD